METVRRITWWASLLLSLVFAGCGGLAGPGQLTPTITQERIPFGEYPSYVVSHDGFMWVLDGRSKSIGKIDPATNEVIETFDLSDIVGERGFLRDMTFGAGSLWVSIMPRQRIYELDPSDGSLRGSFKTEARSPAISFVKGSLWFVDGDFESPNLARVDPQSGRVIKRFPLGPINSHVNALVAYEGSIWVVRERARHVAGTRGQTTFFLWDQLWRIDPSSNRLVSRRPLGSTYTRGPVNPVTGRVLASNNGLWMSRVHEHRLLHMAPRTGRVRQEISVTEFRLPWEFALVGGELWVGDLNRTRVTWIDPESKEREIVDVGDDTSFIGSGFGSAWVPVYLSSNERGEVVRLTHE